MGLIDFSGSMIDFGKPTTTNNVTVVPPPKEEDVKVPVAPQKAEEPKAEVPANMIYMAIQERGESKKISRDEAINGLTEKTYYRVQVSRGKDGAKATIDRFTCEPYAPFQVFDTKVHNAGGYNSAKEAIELAEISVLVDVE